MRRKSPPAAAASEGAELAEEGFPLFERFPRLARTVPRVPLAHGPSPVSRLDHLSLELGHDVWIKDDGRYGTVYGGNKPRKLEFVLADAMRTNAKSVVTTGGIGTNHGLATALYSRQLGIDTLLLLTYEDVTEEARNNLLLMAGAGAEIHYIRSYLPATVLAPYHVVSRWRRDGQRPYLIGPGASNPLACLGYVNAALELAAQVKSGLLPEPATIVLPVGTGGTAAGLLLGLGVAGLRSRILAVSITRAPTAWLRVVTHLARSTSRLLARRSGDPSVTGMALGKIRLTRNWLGPGFGRASQDGDLATARLLQSEGLALDPVYTAKAMAALLETASTPRFRGPVLFWHTHNAIPMPHPGPDAVARIPVELRRICGM
jgi:D-cysteine desulfhydrase